MFALLTVCPSSHLHPQLPLFPPYSPSPHTPSLSLLSFLPPSLPPVSSPQDLSEGEVWAEHHSQVAHFQEEYQRREQLTKAVHAALSAGRRLGYTPFAPTQQHCSSSPGSPGNTQQEGAGTQHAPQGQQQEDGAMQLDEPPVAGSGHAAAGRAAEQCSPGGSSGCVSEDNSSETTHSNAGTRGSSLSGSTAGGCERVRVGGCERLEAAAEPAQEQAEKQAGTAAAGAEVGCDAARDSAACESQQQQEQQQQQQQADEHESWPCAPVWGVSDYEEELRQLSEQLQVRAGGAGA
jgi:hypothetical protein